jgi:uncharacterized membrane protein YedE/YeeE
MTVTELLAQPWPWFVAGPLIGLFVPVLLLAGNRTFGFSSNLRHLCAAAVPGRLEFLRYDWRAEGGWNLAFLAGTVAGGVVALHFLGVPDVALSEETKAALSALGLQDFSGLAPREVFDWARLWSPRTVVLVSGGGFLVGFGTAYAGGCTSGHAISGLADFQRPSLLAVLGFFAGGLLATHVLLPLVF